MGGWICKFEAQSFPKPLENKRCHSNRGPKWGVPILKIQPPKLKQSRTGLLYQLAIKRQSLDGVVVDNQSVKTPGMKRSSISMLVIYVCTGTLKIIKT